MANVLSSLPTVAARVMRRPLAIGIGCLGVTVGFPVGRLLHRPAPDPERQGTARPATAVAYEKPQPPPQRQQYPGPQQHAPPPAPPHVSRQDSEAVRVAEALLKTLKEWQEREKTDYYSVPLFIAQEAAALGARADVEQVITRLAKGKPASLADIVLASWADRNPQAAWDFYARAVRERKPPLGSVPQFARRMAQYHWEMVESQIPDLPDYASYTIQEMWSQRVGVEVRNPAALRQMILEEVPEKLRGACLHRALWLLAAEHPQEAMALLQELPEKERMAQVPQFAELLAKSQPALALDLVRKHREEMYFSGRDDHDNAEVIFSGMMRREGMAPALSVLADLYNKNRDADTRRAAANLPRRTAEWMPSAVTAAQGQATGAEFLSALVERCPWESSAVVCGEIAAIADGGLQAAAAESWAWRWSAQDPEAARQWAENLPPAARARALCGLWKSGTPPTTALEACAQAGTVPSEGVMEEMILTAPQTLNQWLAEQPGTTSRQLARAARAWSTIDPGAAADWAAGFPDGAERVQAVTGVMQMWLQRSPDTAVAWLNAVSLDDEERAAVQTFTGLGPR